METLATSSSAVLKVKTPETGGRINPFHRTGPGYLDAVAHLRELLAFSKVSSRTDFPAGAP